MSKIDIQLINNIISIVNLNNNINIIDGSNEMYILKLKYINVKIKF